MNNYNCAGDNRFELIEKYKNKLINATNISSSPEEMKVLDDIFFRLWQMDWLDILENLEKLTTKFEFNFKFLLKVLNNFNVYVIKHWDKFGDKTNYDEIVQTVIYSIVPDEKCFVRAFDEQKYYFKDYGKTWALTKEELEK